MTETKQQGEFRILMPQEVGHAIVTFRKTLGMKQLTLALEAGVDERTVQRIERGEKVNDDTLRKIAKVFGMKEDSFLGARYVPTKEEARAKVEEMLSEMLVAEASDFTTLRDCDAVLGKHGYIVNDEHVAIDAADEVAAFRDLLTDWGDLYDGLSHTDRLEACRSIHDAVRKIEAKGYRTRYCVYTTDDQCQVSVLMFVPRTDEHLNKLNQFLVPRNLGRMMKESLGW